ncbi:hypothetical protein ABZ820_41835 [Streptomyces diacarni]|uniref:hypothetical protein n=1 Tax=Streptomyces diacarni TaxID=2800381 RepID=UPI0033FE95FB
MTYRPSAPTTDCPAPWLPITSTHHCPGGPMTSTDDYETRRLIADLSYAAGVAAVLLRSAADRAESGQPIDPAVLRSAADDLTQIAGRGRDQ